MTFESIFEVTAEPPSIVSKATRTRRSKAVENLLLIAIVIISAANIVLATGETPALWIACYATSVFLGVPLLGFHTQNVLRRFESDGHVATSSTRALRVLLAIMLVAPALIAATRLAVEWSA